MSRIGLQAVSLDRESIKRLKEQKIDAFQSVRECDWSVVIASPERLTAPAFDSVVRSKTFQSNITLYVVDEAHVLRPWSLTFRRSYEDIPQIRLRIPLHVPALALTATLLPGSTETTLLRTLRFRPGYSITRRSSEQPNRRIIFQTLSHGLDGVEFPDLAWFAAGKFKFILYCKTIELGFRVVSYLWRLLPPGKDRRHKIRLYNSLIDSAVNEATIKAIDDDPTVMGVVATIKFGMGIDVRKVVYVGIVGLDDSVEQNRQESGRSVRDPSLNGGSVTYVERSVVQTITKDLLDGKISDPVSDSEVEVIQATQARKKGSNQKSQKKAHDDSQIGLTTQKGGKARRLIDPGLRQLVTAHIQRNCLITTSNRIFGEVYDGSTSPCFTAKRPLPCSSCLVRYPELSRGSILPSGLVARTSVVSLEDSTTSNADEESSSSLLSGNHRSLTKAMRTAASNAIDEFSCSRWAKKEGLRFRHVPYTAHIPSAMRCALLDAFHLVRDREALAGILADWEFLEEDSWKLFDCIRALNEKFDKDHERTRQTRLSKAAETRRRKADLARGQLESDSKVQARPVLQTQPVNTRDVLSGRTTPPP